MNVVKLLTIGLALIGTTVFSSCKKDGCTDAASSNYDSDADKDDGSCEYQGQAVFWYDEATSNDMMTSGSTSVKFYVDGDLVGSNDAAVYWASAPSCGEDATITVTRDLGKAKSQTFPYEVVNNLGITVETGILNITANSCEKKEING